MTVPRIQLHWPTVPSYHADEPALDVLAAVLEGTASQDRLYRQLVLDRSLARQVYAAHPTKSLAGSFEIWAYVLPGTKVDDVVAIIDAEIERLKRDGPHPDEVRKAQVAREKDLVMSLESISGKASLLAQTAASLGRPSRLPEGPGTGLRSHSGRRPEGRQAATSDQDASGSTSSLVSRRRDPLKSRQPSRKTIRCRPFRTN